MNSSRLAILIPVHNGIEYTRKSLKNIRLALNDSELLSRTIIIVIDDGSNDNTSVAVKSEFPEVEVLAGDGNLWWTGSVNKGAAYAINYRNSDYLLLWNNDIIASPDYFNVLKEIIDNSKTDIIFGSRIFCNIGSGIIWSKGGVFNSRTGKFYMIGYNKPDDQVYNDRELNWLPGMGTLIPKEVVQKIGLWDNKNFPQYHGDSEYTYRAFLNGFKIRLDPRLVLWNDTTNTGMKHKGDIRLFLKSFNDIKSLYNFKVNFRFYYKYATNVMAYSHLMNMYFRYFGGFIKRKIVLKS